MKIILSRKGFDSSEGKVASPIFPSGGLCCLPIPTQNSGPQYKAIQYENGNLGPVVSDLTKGKILPDDKAHLDPDLNYASLTRENGWKPLFGQTGAAQGHLSSMNIGKGDVFLFYGWFKIIEISNGKYQYKKDVFDLHVLFGWLQVEQIIPAHNRTVAPKWAQYHPHFNRPSTYDNDSVYVATDKLSIPGADIDLSGGGVFETYHSALCLTAPNQTRSVWRLPSWFYPSGGKSALSYHGDQKRWEKQNDYVHLKCVGRGQEFVLDCDDYPEALSWLSGILEHWIKH